MESSACHTLLICAAEMAQGMHTARQGVFRESTRPLAIQRLVGDSTHQSSLIGPH